MKKGLHTFLNEFEVYIGAVLFAAMTALLTLQVITRYLFHYSFSWTEELCTVFFIWLCYLGACGAVLKGKHLRIDGFLNSLHGTAKKVLLIFTDLVTMGFCLYMIPPLMKIIANFAKRNSATILLRMPKAVIYSVLPFCFVLMTVRLLQDCVRIARSSGDDVKITTSKSLFDKDESDTETGEGGK
ncbi:MAG: TRAP transporter small permease [Pyramidobacter sp.]|nr:TRAP transporter small permease [Pyramidobacter sp.]